MLPHFKVPLKYILILHTFQLSSIPTINILIVPVHLHISASMTSSGEGSQSTNLDNSNKPVGQHEWWIAAFSNFAISYWWRISSIHFLLSIDLSIPKRLLYFTQLRSVIGLYYLFHTNIDLKLITANQPGFEPASLGPKMATLPLSYPPLTWDTFLCLSADSQSKLSDSKLDQIWAMGINHWEGK